MNEDDILVIDTGVAAGVKKQEEEILPLRLVDPSSPVLNEPIPEYDVTTLPNPGMTNLIKRLKMTMKLHGGFGISANQCGIKERVFIIGSENLQFPCINPKIVDANKPLIMREGCLSFPGLSLKVSRHEVINVLYYTEFGDEKLMEFSGITAQCFQHELDHMNGILFTHHVKPLALKMAKQKQEKVIKKYRRTMK
jgi:peptide deformylase